MRAPQGAAFLAGGLEVPREESLQGVTGIQKGAKGEIEIPLPPFALAGEAARPQAMTFNVVCYNCYSLRGSTHLRWGQRDQGGLRSPP